MSNTLQSQQPRPLVCRRGHHTWTHTFRPSEELCLLCGLVTYCPVCFDEQHLMPARRGRPFECEQHQGHVSTLPHPQESEAHAR